MILPKNTKKRSLEAGKVPEAAKANPEQSAAIIEAQQKAQAALQAYLAQVRNELQTFVDF